MSNSKNQYRVYLAVFASVFIHLIIFFILLNNNGANAKIDNSILAYDNSRISLSISKTKPIEQIKPKETIKEEIKEPIIKKTETKEVVEKEISNDKKNQEQIPVIENATFKGKRTPPNYPKRALMLKQEGVVLLKALITINGNIKDIKIIKSSGYDILDKSAISAVEKWQFEPSYINGKPSLSWVKVPIEFSIK